MLNAFLVSGEDQYVVITLHYCKVKTFQGNQFSSFIKL